MELKNIWESSISHVVFWVWHQWYFLWLDVFVFLWNIWVSMLGKVVTQLMQSRVSFHPYTVSSVSLLWKIRSWKLSRNVKTFVTQVKFFIQHIHISVLPNFLCNHRFRIEFIDEAGKKYFAAANEKNEKIANFILKYLIPAICAAMLPMSPLSLAYYAHQNGYENIDVEKLYSTASLT